MCMKNTIIHFRMGQLYEILEPTFKEVPKKAYIMAAAALLIIFADSCSKRKRKGCNYIIGRTAFGTSLVTIFCDNFPYFRIV